MSQKLYTEEQVKGMIDDAHNGVDGYYDIFKKHSPIELPSDEQQSKIGNSDNSQTAVEWLVKELNLEGYDYTIQQAKAMEKEKMRKCASFWRGKENEIEKPMFDIYYNETYNK